MSRSGRLLLPAVGILFLLTCTLAWRGTPWAWEIQLSAWIHSVGAWGRESKQADGHRRRRSVRGDSDRTQRKQWPGIECGGAGNRGGSDRRSVGWQWREREVQRGRHRRAAHERRRKRWAGRAALGEGGGLRVARVAGGRANRIQGSVTAGLSSSFLDAKPYSLDGTEDSRSGLPDLELRSLDWWAAGSGPDSFSQQLWLSTRPKGCLLCGFQCRAGPGAAKPVRGSANVSGA